MGKFNSKFEQIESQTASWNTFRSTSGSPWYIYTYTHTHTHTHSPICIIHYTGP